MFVECSNRTLGKKFRHLIHGGTAAGALYWLLDHVLPHTSEDTISAAGRITIFCSKTFIGRTTLPNSITEALPPLQQLPVDHHNRQISANTQGQCLPCCHGIYGHQYWVTPLPSLSSQIKILNERIQNLDTSALLNSTSKVRPKLRCGIIFGFRINFLKCGCVLCRAE